MSTHCRSSCHCLVTTSPEYYVTSSCQNESRTHARKWSMMAKESSEGEFLKKNVLITTGKGLKIYPRHVKEKVIDLDQLEFLPIFPYLEL